MHKAEWDFRAVHIPEDLKRGDMCSPYLTPNHDMSLTDHVPVICRRDLAHPLANELDLHELNAHSADAALLVWLRYLKFNMQQTGSRQPFGPNCPRAVIVTGASHVHIGNLQ